MRIPLVALIVSILFCSGSFGQTYEEYKTFRDSLVQNENAETAIAFFNAELVSNPNSSLAKVFLGSVYTSVGNLEEAAALYQPPQKDWWWYLEYALFLQKSNNPSQAENVLNEAIEGFPEQAALYGARASLKINTGRTIGVLSDLNKAVTLDPEDTEWYLRRALFNLDNGYYRLAESDFQLALSLRPKSSNIYYLLAQLFFESGQLEKSLEAVNSALLLKPESIDLLSSKGRIYSELGMFQEGLATFNSAIAIDSNNFLPYYFRALLYFNQEDMDSFCIDLKKVRELKEAGADISPDWVRNINLEWNDVCNTEVISYYYQRGIAAYNKGNFTEAILQYEEGLKIRPNHALTTSFLGNAYFQLKAYESAITHFKDFLALKSQLPQEYNEVKMAASMGGSEPVGAIVISQVFYYMGLSSAGLNDFSSAIAYMDSSIFYGKGYKEAEVDRVFAYRGLLHALQGNVSSALTDFNSSIALQKRQSLAYLMKTALEMNQIIGVSSPTDLYNFLDADKPLQFEWYIKKNKNIDLVRPLIEFHIEELQRVINFGVEDGNIYYLLGTLRFVLRDLSGCSDLAKARTLGVNVTDFRCK